MLLAFEKNDTSKCLSAVCGWTCPENLLARHHFTYCDICSFPFRFSARYPHFNAPHRICEKCCVVSACPFTPESFKFFVGCWASSISGLVRKAEPICFILCTVHWFISLISSVHSGHSCTTCRASGVLQMSEPQKTVFTLIRHVP